MWPKKKKDKSDKKRKFLMKKFRSRVVIPSMLGPYSAALGFIFVDGGIVSIPLYLALVAGTSGASYGLGHLADKNTTAIVTRKSLAEQKIKAPIWAHNMQNNVQYNLIDTFNGLSQKDLNTKERKKLEKQKAKLLDISNDLENYLDVVDEDGNKTGEDVIYLTRKPQVVTTVKIDDETRINAKGKDIKPKGPKGLSL